MRLIKHRQRFKMSSVVGIALIAGVSVWVFNWFPNIHQRQQQLPTELHTKKWLFQQKEALRSGERTRVDFLSTSGTDSLLREFAGMPEITSLIFYKTDLSDQGVEMIGKLPNIKLITMMNNPHVGDKGLAILSRIETIEQLEFVNIDVTDSGLHVLHTMPRLKSLELHRECSLPPLLTDAAVSDLQGLAAIERLIVTGGWLSDSAAAELRRLQPEWEVVAD